MPALSSVAAWAEAPAHGVATDDAPVTSARADSQTRYVVGPLYDWIFFLLPPVLALGLGVLISGTAFADREFDFWGQETTASSLLIGIFIHAHLFIVVFRSHGNPTIFRLHRFRFLAAPVLLYAAMMWSVWILLSVSLLVTFWDVYHSGAQTFGFARIYDERAGNDPTVGRRLDWWLNHILYAGPLLAGVTLAAHLQDFGDFNGRSVFLTRVPAFVLGNQRYLTWTVLVLGTGFIAYYVFAQWNLHRQGRKISPLKVYLVCSTGLCSIYTWGFNSWGEAFFIMNFFHALQYFGLVWAREQGNMMRLFRVENVAFGKPIAVVLFLGLAFGYGFWVEALDASFKWLWGITLVVAISHFWYDGFIWSVRRNQI